MHDKFVLWGSAGHSRVLADLIGLRGGVVVALFDNDQNVTSSLVDVPIHHGVAGFQSWLAAQSVPPGDFAASVAVGGVSGAVRQDLAKMMKHYGLRIATLVHPSAVVSRTAYIGEGCQILAQTVVAADAYLGDQCIINNSANVDHECRLGKGVHISVGAVLCGLVHIGDNSFVGAGAVILPRLTVGRDVIVGAGAVVTRDVPDGSVVRGNPARVSGIEQ